MEEYYTRNDTNITYEDYREETDRIRKANVIVPSMQSKEELLQVLGQDLRDSLFYEP